MTKPRKNRLAGGTLSLLFALAMLLALLVLLPAGRTFAQDAPAGPLPPAHPANEAAVPAHVATAPDLGGKPNLSGTWQLNRDLSDNPEQRMQEARNTSGQPASGNHSGWSLGSGPVGLGPSQGGTSGSRRTGGASADEEMIQSLSSVTVEQTATSARVTDGSGDVVALYSTADTSQTKPSSADAKTADVSGAPNNSGSGAAAGPPAAQWQGDRLVAVEKGRRNITTTRSYELSPDGQQLYANIRIQNPQSKQPVTMSLVYDSVQSVGGERP